VLDLPEGERRFRGQAGDAVLYASDTIHRVEPVTRGERLVAITWLQSLVSAGAQRQILFDLAQLATRIGQDANSEDHVMSLTHLHHRLLRMWAR
jgi:PKHD-type hydroxylase